jgi:hypothetical protein
MDEFLIPIAFFAAVVLSLYFYFRARNKERLALIEKGRDLDISKMKWGTNNHYWPLKTGLFFIGISLGLLFGYILEKNVDIHEPVAYLSMMFLFGGIALVVGNLIKMGKDK